MAFLVFEGLDGSGKSTLIKELAFWLSSKNIEYLITKEPGGTPLGYELRSILTRHKSKDSDIPTPKAELLLYEAIRSQHVEHKIKPFLNKKGWVLCDRFTYSSVAFQAGGRQLNIKDVQWLNFFATNGLSPDLIVFLDLPVEEAQRRCHIRSQKDGIALDRFELENIEFHQNVRQAYLDQINEEPNKWLVLNSIQDVSQLKQAVIKEIIARKFI